MNEPHHTHHQAVRGESDVTANVTYDNGTIKVVLTDRHGQPPELESSHEKDMHLVIISADLKDYFHGHPEKVRDGVYTLQRKLNDNHYRAFVDVAPKSLSYAVTPNQLPVGEDLPDLLPNNLSADTAFVRTVGGKTVELKADTLQAGKNATLLFDLKGETPAPYLGALGHVIIVDEQAERFIHVHPAAEDKTEFNAILDEPGTYKLWAEFKFDSNVHVFDFVLEVGEAEFLK